MAAVGEAADDWPPARRLSGVQGPGRPEDDSWSVQAPCSLARVLLSPRGASVRTRKDEQCRSRTEHSSKKCWRRREGDEARAGGASSQDVRDQQLRGQARRARPGSERRSPWRARTAATSRRPRSRRSRRPAQTRCWSRSGGARRLSIQFKRCTTQSRGPPRHEASSRKPRGKVVRGHGMQGPATLQFERQRSDSSNEVADEGSPVARRLHGSAPATPGGPTAGCCAVLLSQGLDVLTTTRSSGSAGGAGRRVPETPARRRRAECWHAAVLPPGTPDAGWDASLPAGGSRDASPRLQLFVTAVVVERRQAALSRLRGVCSRAQPDVKSN